MYLLTTFKRTKGSKNKKTRKDKGKKRVSKKSNIQDNYLKSRTTRNTLHPFLEGAKEIRHWATLGNEISKRKDSKKNSFSKGIKTGRNVLGFVRDLGRL